MKEDDLSDINGIWQVYPATYTDVHGTEQINFFNNGKNLEMEVRGVRFCGCDFDNLKPVQELPPKSLVMFKLNQEELCDCTITYEIPQLIVSPKTRSILLLHVEICLGKPDTRGGLDMEKVNLKLNLGNETKILQSSDDWFEDALLSLQKQMPKDHFFVNCFNCAYADYFYGGHGFFGSMACFRCFKEEYLAVHTKNDYILLWEKNKDSTQETSVCPDFMPRIPNTGYRG